MVARNQKTQPDPVAAMIGPMRRAALAGTYAGKVPTPYFMSCRRVIPELGVSVCFTRDVGYHTSGWWKNPDYERCFHLSLAFYHPYSNNEPRPRDYAITDRFIRGLYGDARRMIWCEPPYSEKGKREDIWHYRLFCDEGWQPIKPRGEVYEKELTEAGWKSYSDVQADALKKSLAELNGYMQGGRGRP